MSDFTVKPLNEATWPDFARLVEKHNGVWGGCWCIGFHPEGFGPKGERSVEKNRSNKECRVREGRAHAALVYDGPNAVGWCQFGSPDELTRIKFKKAYESGLLNLPDWRITCFFVDKDYRGQGVSFKALEGALQEIAKLGGGVVESMPEDTEGRSVPGAFKFNATLRIFEKLGFEKIRKLGKNHWLVTKIVEPLGR
jgi:GNAT superfamily N-acetyltransferase